MQSSPPQQSQSSPHSLLWTRIFGVCLIPCSSALGYAVMARPLLQAQQTGSLQSPSKAVLFPPALLYMGIALCVADLRDGATREVGPDGKPRLTRKGKVFVGRLIAILLLAAAGWLLLLHVLVFADAV